MKCPACLCSTSTLDRCQWCSKPILDAPRDALPEEKKVNRAPSRYLNGSKHSEREDYMDRYLREVRMYMKHHNLNPAQFNEKVGLAACYRQLEYGNRLKVSTQKKLDKILELV